MEQKRELRNRPTYKYSQLTFEKEEQRQSNGAKRISSKSSAITTGHLHAKNECGHRPYTLHKN